VPEGDLLLRHAVFRGGLIGAGPPRATLAYGEPVRVRGFHVVATETEHWVENLTGLGGCGAHLFLGVVGEQALPGHPLVPLLQVAEAGAPLPPEDVDAFLGGDPVADERHLHRLLAEAAGSVYVPAARRHGFTDFQITRGWLGVST
jgi:hypothetical protein